MLQEGDKAPGIRLRTDSGAEFKLSDCKGKRVVLYFYPRADTPGCTTEACEFRDGIQAFAKKGAVVVGISPDKPAAQAKFKQKYDLPFTLLADEEKAAAEAFGVWKEKNMYGKKTMGIRAQHLRHRTGWEDREGLFQSEGSGPRREGAGKPLTTSLLAPASRQSCSASASALASGTGDPLPRQRSQQVR
jgi:peroxiredoxin Q/BCP